MVFSFVCFNMVCLWYDDLVWCLSLLFQYGGLVWCFIMVCVLVWCFSLVFAFCGLVWCFSLVF